MTGWLINMAQSSTSLVSLLIGIVLIVILGLRGIRKEYVGSYFLLGILVCSIAEFGFGVSNMALEILGKDPTLSDRTEVWRDCLKIPINPILGAGFESFWLGDRLKIMWAKWYWRPNQAHNGYIETYLNLGLVGLFLMIGMLLSTFWKARREFLTNFHFGRLRIAFVSLLVAYNWTEASFKALHPMWIVFYIIALDYPKMAGQATSESADDISSDEPISNLDRHPQAERPANNLFVEITSPRYDIN